MLTDQLPADSSGNGLSETWPNLKFWLILSLTCAVMIAVLFGWTIQGAYFFSDDFTWLWHGTRVDLNLYRVLTFRMSSFYSPVLNLFYSAMYRIFSLFAPAYFTFGLLLHLANSLLAAIVVWQLSRSRLSAAVCGLLFAIAGTAFEPLVWIGANMHSIAAFFILAGSAYYVGYLNGGKKIYLLLTFLAALLAIGSKEIAAIFPLLLIAIIFIFWQRYKNKIFAKAHLFFWAGIIISFTLYGWQQFIWQKQSVAVASGTFAFSWHTIAKLPIVFADLFVPLGGLTPSLHGSAVGVLLLISTIFLAVLFYIYRKILLVRLGFLWMIIAVAPTVMLSTANWWDPLASRYTYLPRFGMIIIIAAILVYHLEKKSAKWLIGLVAAAIVLLSSWQIIYMFQTVNRDYPYVYQTGRSLVVAMEKVKDLSPDKLIIRADHPFASNNSYLFGAATIIGRVSETQISFPPLEEKINLSPGDALFYWDANAREFKIRFSPK